ncbi:MAG: sulfite exporter TauE/SafE family protein [Oscillospiraceae bacterium]|nr:sulfite exporter TauE/SafE family protein [Oscillospiraceae bacterium]
MSSSERLYIGIEGIYCAHCVDTITRTLRAMEGVEEVSVRQNVARVSGHGLPGADALVAAIRHIGYETDESRISRDRTRVAKGLRWYEFLLIAAAILLFALGLERLFGYNIFNAIPTVDSSLSYGMLFVTGLLTSIHCVSMCGAIGIFASTETNSVRSLRRPLLYQAGRVCSYTLIGGVVGAVGSVFRVSETLRGALILVAAAFMLLMALSMLGLFQFSLPRLFHLRLPAGRNGPFLIGLLNGLMPCGPLQAMQLYALSTGSPLSGALAMLLFALGTVPLMLLSGVAINLSRGRAKRVIGKVASVLMVILALSMLNRGLLSLGVDVTRVLPTQYNGYLAATAEDGVQTVAFDLDYDTYADIVVQKDVPVRITVHADAGKLTGCNNEIISRDFGFDIPLKEGDNLIEFTPTEEGDFSYSCWMHMITNHIRVVDDADFFAR